MQKKLKGGLFSISTHLPALVTGTCRTKQLHILEEWKESHSGIPDAVSSISSNNWQYLKVVANSGRIDDKEIFAREVVQMCWENITVYLNWKDLEKGESVCEIEFCTEEYMEDCDIKNFVEKK